MKSNAVIYTQYGQLFTAFVPGETISEQVRTYPFGMSVGRESVETCLPLHVGAVIITKQEFEAAKAQALTALGLISTSAQDALFLEICDVYDAQEAAKLLA